MDAPGRTAVAALLKGQAGHNVRVAGVTLGDSASLNRPDLGERAKSFIGGRSFDDASIAFENGTLARIFLYPQAFVDIRWRSAKDVIKVFGEPDHLERGMTRIQLVYRKLSLTIFVYPESRKVQAMIARVSEIQAPRKLSAHDLVQELVGAPWLIDGEAPNYPSAQARRRRATALATELGVNLNRLEDGDFLKDTTHEHAEFHAILRRYSDDPSSDSTCEESHAFTELWRFRRSTTTLMNHNNGVLVASGEYAGLVRLTSVGNHLDELLKDVDTALALLLDPEKQLVDEAHLFEKGWVSDGELIEMEADEW